MEGYPRPGSCYLNVLLISRCNPLDILRILHSGFQKNNKQHLECLIVNLQVGFQKTASLASNNNLSEFFDKSGLASKNDYIYVYICLQGSSLGQESIVDYVDVSFAMIAALVI